MSRTFPLVSGPQAPPTFDLGFGMTPASPSAPEAGGACACADIGVLWGENADVSLDISDTNPLNVVAVATGTICPGTEWTVDIGWDGDEGSVPGVAQIGDASAWAISWSATGTLTLTFHALCAGVTLDAAPITLNIGSATVCLQDAATELVVYNSELAELGNTFDVEVPTSQTFSTQLRVWIAGDVLDSSCCIGGFANWSGEIEYVGDDIESGGGGTFGLALINATEGDEGVAHPLVGGGCAAELSLNDVWFASSGMSGAYTATIHFTPFGEAEPVFSIVVTITVHS